MRTKVLGVKVVPSLNDVPQEDPPPCNSGIVGIEEDPNIIPIIHYGHYY